MAIHEDGVVNVSESMVKQARKDFIKGGKYLYGKLKKIPTQEELYSDKTHVSLTNNQDVRWMYDAWRFVINDPYQFFGDIGETIIINSWKKEAILEYYKALYLIGAEKVYITHPKSKKIHLLTDGEIIQRINDNKVAAEYITARNYISGLSNKDDLFKEWNIAAINRARHPLKKRGPSGRIPINETEYHKQATKKRLENIEKAKELYEEGLSRKEIAKELGVTEQCIRLYLHS